VINVLIIEDEHAIRRFLRTALEADGMRVRTVAGGNATVVHLDNGLANRQPQTDAGDSRFFITNRGHVINVLIIEDEHAIRRFLRTALEADGMRVFESCSSLRADSTIIGIWLHWRTSRIKSLPSPSGRPRSRIDKSGFRGHCRENRPQNWKS
jgi:PleD family two-component response regulator